MVGSIDYKNADPQRKGRGAGWYWHRGNGQWSKYTGNLDAQFKHPRHHIKSAKGRQMAQLKDPHKADYNKGKKKRPKPNKPNSP